MLRALTATLFAACLAVTTGCTTIVDAVTTKPIEPDPNETAIGTDLNDLQIEVSVGVNIKKAHKELDRAHVNVHAHNGIVLLTGEVPSADLRTLAGDTARKFRGVRQVHNELQISGKSSLLARTTDTWLTTKVRSKFILEKNFKGSDVKIITEGNVVYLMGIVSQEQGRKAANIASRTGGVKRVVKVFEYHE
ncbi:BON domain-containing protein [bacterium SCSIO 12696]|nr:BON domain-containing protein [bacterium SCSIO 12696]